MPSIFAASVLLPPTDLSVAWMAAFSISSSVLPPRPSRVFVFFPWERNRSLVSILPPSLRAAARARDVLQLPHIARPMIRAERLGGLRGQAGDLLPTSTDIPSRRCSAIFSRSSLRRREGRDEHAHGREAVEEVFGDRPAFTSFSRSLFVAATTRTSTVTERSAPTRFTSRWSSARRSLG